MPIICPNCQSTMDEDESCPECNHTDNDIDCECDACNQFHVEHPTDTKDYTREDWSSE